LVAQSAHSGKTTVFLFSKTPGDEEEKEEEKEEDDEENIENDMGEEDEEESSKALEDIIETLFSFVTILIFPNRR
jgi:hypothetical protein